MPERSYEGIARADKPQFLRDNYPTNMLSHEELASALHMAANFADDERVVKGDYFQRQFQDFTDAVSDIPGYAGVFGTGYPFYAEKQDGGIHAVPEISRYTTSFLELVQKDSLRGYGAWICGACQIDSPLPDLKSKCKPCGLVDIKPRDIFKALPDVDYWVVIDADKAGTMEEVERGIELRLEDIGFYVSDKSIFNAIRKSMQVMTDIVDGRDTQERLPVDLHVVTKQNLLNRIGRVAAAIRTGEDVPISARSLHVVWEDTDVPYDFIKDFLFSLTDKNVTDPDIRTALQSARSEVKTIVGDDAPAFVAQRAPKEARQLHTAAIAGVLRNRVACW